MIGIGCQRFFDMHLAGFNADQIDIDAEMPIDLIHTPGNDEFGSQQLADFLNRAGINESGQDQFLFLEELIHALPIQYNNML